MQVLTPNEANYDKIGCIVVSGSGKGMVRDHNTKKSIEEEVLV